MGSELEGLLRRQPPQSESHLRVMQTTGSASADAGGGTRFASLRNLRLGQMRNFVIAELKGVLKDLQLKTSGLKGDLQHRIEVRALLTRPPARLRASGVSLSLVPTRAAPQAFLDDAYVEARLALERRDDDGQRRAAAKCKVCSPLPAPRAPRSARRAPP